MSDITTPPYAEAQAGYAVSNMLFFHLDFAEIYQRIYFIIIFLNSPQRF
jgi:hypothetical protein